MTVRTFLVGLLLVPTIASAQSANPPGQAPERSRYPLVYEVFAGATQPTTAGRLTEPPAGAPPPPSRVLTGSVGMSGGFELVPRIALLGELEVVAGRPLNAGGGSWGALNLFGVARFQLPRRLELEAGAGIAQLGYQPPANLSVLTTRYWSPAARAGVGYDLFRFEDVAMSLYARAALTRVQDISMRTVSVQLAITGRYWP